LLSKCGFFTFTRTVPSVLLLLLLVHGLPGGPLITGVQSQEPPSRAPFAAERKEQGIAELAVQEAIRYGILNFKLNLIGEVQILHEDFGHYRTRWQIGENGDERVQLNVSKNNYHMHAYTVFLLINGPGRLFFDHFFWKNCLTKMLLTPIFHFFGLIRLEGGPFIRGGRLLEEIR
jgi:hypothetical protein